MARTRKKKVRQKKVRRGLSARAEEICRRLGIDEPRHVEIESKRRVRVADVSKLRRWLDDQRDIEHAKTAFFFDQFLDTPRRDLFRRGASLRLRYKNNGANVYLQYKGPGFHRDGLLYRSEFSTAPLRHFLRERSDHGIVHLGATRVSDLVANHAEPAMARAMRRHLGARILSEITSGQAVSTYRKEKYAVDLETALLEPSLDRVFTFNVDPHGVHPLATFCEYENEIKAAGEDLVTKLEHLEELLEFDRRLCARFRLRSEPLDKYHRCLSFFISPKGAKKRFKR